MKIGAAIVFTDYAAAPAELVRALEERGSESSWAPEHSHIPVARESGFPSGGDLPKAYGNDMRAWVDPDVSGAAAVLGRPSAGALDGAGLFEDTVQEDAATPGSERRGSAINAAGGSVGAG